MFCCRVGVCVWFGCLLGLLGGMSVCVLLFVYMSPLLLVVGLLCSLFEVLLILLFGFYVWILC